MYLILHPTQRISDIYPFGYSAEYTTDMHRVFDAKKNPNVVVYKLNNLQEIVGMTAKYEEIL